MSQIHLFRKRIIPEECIPLKDDLILQHDDDIILTKWNTLKPKKDFHHGLSCYFLKDGFKVSKFYTREHRLIYWYCDIVKYSYEAETNTYIFTDLLADVIVFPDGTRKVMDLGEMADALDDKLISCSDLSLSLRTVDRLLSIIYSGEFSKIQHKIDVLEEKYR